MIRNLFKDVLQSSFFKSTFTLISGTVIAQAFSFILLIVLQRWFYSPEDFGILSFYTSFSAIFITVSTLKYEYAIIVEKDQKNVYSLVFLCLAFIMLSSMLSIVFMLVFGARIFSDLSSSDVVTFAWAVPAVILFGGVYDTLIMWNTAANKFSRTAYSRVAQNVSTELTRLILAPTKMGGTALIVGRLFGHFVSSIFLMKLFFESFKRSKQQVTIASMKGTAYRYRDFPLFTMPTIFITNFTTWLFVYLFYDFYGSVVMGLVSMAIQYIALPFNILSGAFSQVFYKKIADITSRADLLRVYKTISQHLLIVSLLGIVSVMLIPEKLIITVLGENWDGLGYFMKVAVLWQTVAFISSSLSFIYTRLLLQRVMIVYAVFQLLVVYATLKAGNLWLDSPLETFGLFVTGQVTYYLFAIISAFQFIKKSKILT